MKTHLIIDGNAVYELDEECLMKKRIEHRLQKLEKNENIEVDKKNKTKRKK